MDYFEKRRQEFSNYYNDGFNNDYMNEVITDELYDEDGYYDDDLDFVGEGLGDMVQSIKEHINNAIKKLKELWAKFKAWIQNLIKVILNMFKSGEKLVQQYESELREQHKRKGNTIKFHGHIYSIDDIDMDDLRGMLDADAADEAVDDGDNSGDGMDELKNEYKDANTSNFEADIIADITDNDCKNKSEYLEWMAEEVRDKEKKNHVLADIPVDTFINLLGNGKKLIKELKVFEKDVDRFFKEAINDVNSMKSDYDDDKDAIKAIKKYVTYVKKMSSLVISGVKVVIKEIKDGLRLYTGLARKLLDNRIKGKDGEDDDEDVDDDDDVKALPAPNNGKALPAPEADKKRRAAGRKNKQTSNSFKVPEDDDMEHITPDEEDIISPEDWAKQRKEDFWGNRKKEGGSNKSGGNKNQKAIGNSNVPSTQRRKQNNQKAIGSNAPSTKVRKQKRKALGQNSPVKESFDYVSETKERFKK